MTINASEFDVVRKFIAERAAIVLEPGKEYLVEARLGPLARADGCTINQLIARLRTGSERPLNDRVVEALTTNETAFFRDVKPFEVLRNVVMPEILARKAAIRTLNIWCAASSSGQEPYTIAMTLKEHFPQLAGWQVRILCTDISSEMVTRTRNGRYSQLEVGRGMPAPLLVKYFNRAGLEWEVSGDLKKWIDVRTLNLATAWGALPKQDIVFCRNVLIYFNVDTKRHILQRTRELIKPDGYLFLGAAESTRGLDDQFETVQTGTSGCYRVIGAANATAVGAVKATAGAAAGPVPAVRRPIVSERRAS
ncbi:MAG: CheR family methyltransferase [Acidimicrobiales bacterium]